MSADSQDTLRLGAVGDMLLLTDPASGRPDRKPQDIFRNCPSLFAGCDVVLGNLECTLSGDGKVVPTEPRVVATPELVEGIAPAGFHIVSLANNHTFDCMDEGFARTRRQLDDMCVAHFGAGANLEDACLPAIVTVKGLRLAFLGVVEPRCGKCQVATAESQGVCPLDVDELARRIARLKKEVHHVIVSIHWGDERFLIPSPQQVLQAHALADAGASLILGHHPHVVQGLETYRGVPIAYSLGNFVATEVPFTNGDHVTWGWFGRQGCLLMVELNESACVNVRQVSTFDDGCQVAPDSTRRGRRRIAKANRLVERGVSVRRYQWEHLLVNTIRPIIGHLRLSSLRRLRPAHLRKALAGIAQARKVK